MREQSFYTQINFVDFVRLCPWDVGEGLKRN